MAFENPEIKQTSLTLPTDFNLKKKSFHTILTIALLISLLATWVYIINDKNKNKESFSEKETIIMITAVQRDQLQKELEDAAMRYEVLKTSNSKKDSSITVKDTEIEVKKAKIRKLLSKVDATASDIAEARNLIKNLNTDIDGYKDQVKVLQQQKIQLVTEKNEVTSQRDKALRKYDSSNTVIKRNENLIDVGSTLHASNFGIIGINEKKHGKEKSTLSANKVDKLRIRFDIDENMLTKSGTKEIYVCIKSPNDTTIATKGLGSGYFKTRQDSIILYTQKIILNYVNNKKQTVSFDWKLGTNFTGGIYKIEVYNNGFKVGEGYKPLR